MIIVICPQQTAMATGLKYILALGHNKIWQPQATKVHLWLLEYDYILYEQSNIKTGGCSHIGVVIKAHFLIDLLLRIHFCILNRNSHPWFKYLNFKCSANRSRQCDVTRLKKCCPRVKWLDRTIRAPGRCRKKCSLRGRRRMGLRSGER